MRQWRLWFGLTLLACLPILSAHSSGAGLLADTDTSFLLRTIRERGQPLSWFTGDWPLQNHFYRPFPTLTFELDNALHGSNAAGYGWTNAVLCVLCTLALFWLLSELSQNARWAFAGSALFALWTIDFAGALTAPLFIVAGLVVVAGLLRHGIHAGRYVPSGFVLYFLAIEIGGSQAHIEGGLRYRLIEWLPGRTASVMTFFALVALAAYVRFERARGPAKQPGPTPLDRPTGMRAAANHVPKHAALWLALCVLALLAALGSYEQAVMLPPCLLGLAVYLRWQNRSPLWPVHALFWLVLGGYLGLRHVLLPSGVSGYQAQQFRHGPGVWQDLAAYASPNLAELRYVWIPLSMGAFMLLSTAVLGGLASATSTVVSAFQAKRNWKIVVCGWVLSLLAFLPMAWLKQFGHYHYWPMALRTIFVLGMAKVAWDLLSIAVCPPELQAPPRPSPAPGSLPRP